MQFTVQRSTVAVPVQRSTTVTVPCSEVNNGHRSLFRGQQQSLFPVQRSTSHCSLFRGQQRSLFPVQRSTTVPVQRSTTGPVQSSTIKVKASETKAQGTQAGNVHNTGNLSVALKLQQKTPEQARKNSWSCTVKAEEKENSFPDTYCFRALHGDAEKFDWPRTQVTCTCVWQVTRHCVQHCPQQHSILWTRPWYHKHSKAPESAAAFCCENKTMFLWAW